MLKKLIAVIVLPLFLINCSAITGEEIGRLEINNVSTGGTNIFDDEITLDLKRDDKIAFWSDMDMEYEDDVKLRFRVKVFKNGTKISEFEIDPTNKNITLGELKSDIMGKTKWSFSGKNHELKIEEDGAYTIKGILIASKNPSLKITKAELVIKI